MIVPDPSQLLLDARRGNSTALGSLLEFYRGYLKLLARIQLRPGNGDPSDLTQEVYLKAHRAFHQFRGTTEAELTAWLRQILARCLADWHRTQRKRHEDGFVSAQAIGAELDRTTQSWGTRLICSLESPLESAERRESAVLLAQALDRLPVDYREAVVLRHIEELSSEEVARRMGRSVGSVRKLWARGMIELRQILRNLS